MKITVIIPAAGIGKRFADAADPLAASEKSKIELDLGGRPVFQRAIERFRHRDDVEQIVMAVDPAGFDEFKFKYGDRLGFHRVQLVKGGEKERWQTVLNALAAVNESSTHIAVHDAARPLTSPQLVDRVFDAAERYPAVIPARAVHATLKKAAPLDEGEAADKADPLDAIFGDAGRLDVKKVERTIDRRDLVEVQTPQLFEAALLRRAYEQLEAGKVAADHITDDASLVEALGETVYIVDGESTNLKITLPDDMQLARAYMRTAEKKEAASLGRKKLLGGD